LEEYSYYPGCTAHGTAVEYEATIRTVCDLLEIELRELPDWNCCGASSAHAVAPDLAVGLAERNLAQADRIGLPLIVPCSACFNRLRSARVHEAEEGAAGSGKEAGVEIRFMLDLAASPENMERIQEAVKQHLEGLTVVPYYGCLSVRPPAVTGSTDHENPQEMDRVLRAIGVEVLDWPYKTLCCGGSLSLGRPDLVGGLCGRLAAMARRAGAAALVTACPLCFMNLDSRQPTPEGGGETPLPVFYFTELIALAMQDPSVRGHFKRHIVPVDGALAGVGFLRRDSEKETRGVL